MPIHDLMGGLVWLYSKFDIKLLTFIAAGFTVYFGYQKVTKKICVSYSVSTGKLYNTHVTNFVISNKRDNVVIISSLNMTIGKKGTIEIINFDAPLVLKGYESELVELPKYSEIYKGGEPVSIELNDSLSFSAITSSGKIIKCDVESSLTEQSLKGRLYKVTKKLDDIVLTRRMGYIFIYCVKDKTDNVIFDKYGFIVGDTPFGYNKFKDMSEEVFKTFLISNGYHDFYDDYALYKVQDNLEVDLVLSKAAAVKG